MARILIAEDEAGIRLLVARALSLEGHDVVTVEDGEEAARTLWARAGIQVLPGAYLSREVDGHNPGRGFIRVALVADADATEPALQRLRAVLYDETTGGEG